MKNKIVVVPSLKELIVRSPGFAKKQLSTWKLDLLALCGFGCGYCSSIHGNYLRINRSRFVAMTEEQVGHGLLPSEDPALTFVYPDIIEKLEKQLQRNDPTWGTGETIVVSMLTDPFSPPVLSDGTTMKALQLLLEHTGFRIRILTKSTAVASPEFLLLYREHQGRFVIGLSIGGTDDSWARKIELGTSTPSARLRALETLQAQGIPTFGMLCPIFPDVLVDRALEELVRRINPDIVEHVWAEPYNDRQNWKGVRASYPKGSATHDWFTRVFEQKEKALWSRYATEIYTRLRDEARRGGWIHKLRFLLYEGDITPNDAQQFAGLEGVLLQCKPGDGGLSKNPSIAALQRKLTSTSSAYSDRSWVES